MIIRGLDEETSNKLASCLKQRGIEVVVELGGEPRIIFGTTEYWGHVMFPEIVCDVIHAALTTPLRDLINSEETKKLVEELREKTKGKKVFLEVYSHPMCIACPYQEALAAIVGGDLNWKVLLIDLLTYPQHMKRLNIDAVPTTCLSIGRPFTGSVVQVGYMGVEEFLRNLMRRLRG